MYTDPADFNINGFNETYPHSWWLPPEGVQRGTVGADGDYLTPLYPATGECLVFILNTVYYNQNKDTDSFKVFKISK